MKKRILVSVCGIGLGHATRCQAIISELLKRKDLEVKVVSYGSGYNFLREQGIECEEFGGFEYKGEQFTFSVLFNILESFRDPTKLRRDYHEFRKIADKFDPDIVLSDTEPNAFFYAYRRAIPNFVLTNLIPAMNNFHLIPRGYITRDILVQRFMIDRLINFMKKRTQRFYVPTFESKVRYMDDVLYTDVIIRKRSDELPSETELKQKLGIDKDFYLVSVGGAEIEKYLFVLLEKILPKFKDKYFIVSSNDVVKKVTEMENMKIFPFLPNALEYVKLCKGIIAPAGHSTISEAIAYKKPVLAVPVRNHIEQLSNAALLAKEGLGSACFLDRKVTVDHIYDCIANFFSGQERLEKNLQKSKIIGNGAAQIAEDISRY
jgi:uncharacterized protein (TIGR00661 family)